MDSKIVVFKRMAMDATRSRRRIVRWRAAMEAALLAVASADASALVNIVVHGEFPSSGFTSGPVYSTTGPEVFDVAFQIDETAAVYYPAGFEVVPGSFVLAHGVYAIGYGAIRSGSAFNFGNQTYSGNNLHNLSFALLQNGVIFAPMFLSDITLGSSPTIEIGIEPNFAGLGSYDFGAFVSGSPRPVFLTNDAEMYDGVNVAFGTVRVSVAAVPESDVAWLMGVGLLLVMFAGKRRFT